MCAHVAVTKGRHQGEEPVGARIVRLGGAMEKSMGDFRPLVHEGCTEFSVSRAL